MPIPDRHVRSWAILALVAVASLGSGCTNTPPPLGGAEPTRFVSEEAVYEVAEPDGSRTTAQVKLLHSGDAYLATTIVGTETFNYEFSAATGTLERTWFVQVNRATNYPWGLDRHAPSLQGYTLNNPSWLARAATPIGPQWALLTDVPAQGSWGELEVDLAFDGGNWTVVATSQCQRQCPLGDHAGERLRIEMTGGGEGLLPASIAYGFETEPQYVTVIRTAHAHEPTLVTTPTTLPSPEPALEGAPRCGYLPCEEGLPSRLSLQYGLEALQQSPQWLSWTRQQQAPHYLSGARVALGARTGLDGVLVDESTIWTFEFFDFQEETRFELAARNLPTGEPGPALVVDGPTSVEDPFRGLYREETFAEPLVPLQATLALVSEQVALPIEGITRLEFNVRAAEVDPDPRLAATISAYWGTYAAWSDLAVGSATTGQPIGHVQIEPR